VYNGPIIDAAAGCTWLKLHPNTQAFDVADPAVHEVVARATEHGLPVLFDAYSPWAAGLLSQP
jgi:hypothetical protein